MAKHKKKSKSFVPIISVFIILIMAAGGLYIFLAHGKTNHHNKVQQNADHSTSSSSTNTDDSEEDEMISGTPDSLIRETISLSKHGKVIHSPFVSGKSKISEVNKQWGSPTETTTTANVHYEEFPNHDFVVGYENQTVKDLRSYDAQLKSIHLNDIKKIEGNPDETRYYKDRSHDQIIYVYHVNATYDLKWVLAKPTNQEPNPKVDHISVYMNANTQTDHSNLVSNMSLDEKLGQMIIAGVDGTTTNSNADKLIKNNKVGGFIFYANNLDTPTQTIQFINQMKTKNKGNRLPLLLSVDQEGGSISRLPGNLASIPTNAEIGKVNNPQLSHDIGVILGNELKEFGFNLDFAPVLDINSNPNNPVIGDRSFGNNAEVVSKLGIETMKGIESQNIIPTIKHFPGHGDTSVDSHLELPVVNKSLKQLQELELKPFANAINDGADVVMVAHILLPKIDSKFPASMSKTIISDVLREQLHYNGVVITDDMTMKAITNHYDIGQAAVDSVIAGSDLILVAHNYNNVIKTIDSLKSAVQNGEISEQRINESVERIIQLKKKYGINDSNVDDVNMEKLNNMIHNVIK